jgi:prepilin-type N-terminal cleavage/methylation domain-containing protein
MRAERTGFTLVELAAAIVVAGFAMLGAVLLLEAVDDSRARIARDARLIGGGAERSAMLRELLANAFATFDSTRPFEGSEDAVDFWTRCAAPRGWLAPCRVAMAIAPRRDSATLTVRVDGTEPRAVAHYASAARLSYLDVEHGRWTSAWRASAELPGAMGVVIARDTLVYLVGPSRD